MTNWERLKMFEFHEFAWFPKIKTLTASYFLPNNNFFFIFEKNIKFSWKLDDLSKTQSYKFFYFLHKKQKWLLRNRICQKNMKNFMKIKQIHELQSLPTSKIQCGCFSYFSNFRKATKNERVFWTSRIFFSQKIHQKYVKFIKFNQFEHV